MLRQQHSRQKGAPTPSKQLHKKQQKRSLHTTKRRDDKKWLITMGSNIYQGLGYPTKIGWQSHPHRVLLPSLKGDLINNYDPLDVKVSDPDTTPLAEPVAVSAGWGTNLAITDEGRVFEWGFSRKTQTMLRHVYYNEKITKGRNWLNRLNMWRGQDTHIRKVPFIGADNDRELREELYAYRTILPSWITADKLKPIKVDVGGDHRGVLTKSGLLLTWSPHGDQYGTLGHGKIQSSSTVQYPTVLPIPNVVDFAFGFNHLVFITESGLAYSSGSGAAGATGLPLTFLNEPKKRAVHRPLDLHTNYALFYEDLKEAVNDKKIIHDTWSNTKATILLDKDTKMPIGHSTVLDTMNSISSSASAGGAGLATTQQPLSPLRRSIISHDQLRIKSSDQFLTTLIDNSRPGGAEQKDGAVDPVDMYNKGLLPSSLPKMVNVSCGTSHTMLLDEDGNVWTMGRNAHGECGHILSNTNINDGRGNIDAHKGVNTGLKPVDFRLHYYPTKVHELDGKKVIKIAAGAHHSVVLTSDGDIYTFGSNEYGQCGRLNELPSTLRTTKLGHKQPWSLPPGKLHISKTTLKDATIVDITTGPYDTLITLSDGRVLCTGSYLSQFNKPHQLFSLHEFNPLSIEQDDPKYLIQSIPSHELTPRIHYNAVQEYEQKLQSMYESSQNINHLSSDIDNKNNNNKDNGIYYHNDGLYEMPRYSMIQSSFGFEHLTAIVKPRFDHDDDNNNNTSINNTNTTSTKNKKSSKKINNQNSKNKHVIINPNTKHIDTFDITPDDFENLFNPDLTPQDVQQILDSKIIQHATPSDIYTGTKNNVHDDNNSNDNDDDKDVPLSESSSSSSSSSSSMTVNKTPINNEKSTTAINNAVNDDKPSQQSPKM